MINTLILLAIVCGAMFITTKVADIVLSWLNVVPKREGTQTSESAITEKVLDSARIFDYCSFDRLSAIDACEIEAGTVCNGITDNTEGLAEGTAAISELIGEHIGAAMEALSDS